MRTELVAPGVLRIALLPFDALNAYVLDDVLVDSGLHLSGRRLFKALRGHSIRAHALTHGHFDHQGSSHEICERLGVPLWCGAGDREAVELGVQSPFFVDPEGLEARLATRMAGRPHPVSRALAEGDSVGTFRVVETPGHTSGHLSFWRPFDRVLILGDVLFHRNPLNFRPGLQEPFAFATMDPARNRQSARRLAELDPAVVCFGHGVPLRDVGRWRAFIYRLPT